MGCLCVRLVTRGQEPSDSTSCFFPCKESLHASDDILSALTPRLDSACKPLISLIRDCACCGAKDIPKKQYDCMNLFRFCVLETLPST